METIWILNHHASANGHRHFELACEFSKYGYQTIVFVSSFLHDTHQYLYDDVCHVERVAPNVLYVYLHTLPKYKGNGAKRVLNMFSYLHMVKRYAPQIWEKYGKPNYVIGSSVHPLAWEAAYWIAHRCKAEFICEVRDLWPLSLIELYGLNKHHPLVMFFALIERRAYQRAAKIVVSLPYGYKYICDEKGFPREKVFWMPNGIQIGEKDEPQELPLELAGYLESHWCCIYTGSLVKSECVAYMVDAFSELRESEIYFAIIGNGHERENLAEQIEKLSLDHVRMFPRIEKAQVITALRKAKCCLAAHENHKIYHFGLSLNKLNDYLVSGTPVIFACDAPNVVQETENISIPYGNPHQLAKAILRVKSMDGKAYARAGESGRSIIESTYDYSIIARKYIEMLEMRGDLT